MDLYMLVVLKHLFLFTESYIQIIFSKTAYMRMHCNITT
jgi:hypothetical protein